MATTWRNSDWFTAFALAMNGWALANSVTTAFWWCALVNVAMLALLIGQVHYEVRHRAGLEAQLAEERRERAAACALVDASLAPQPGWIASVLRWVGLA